VQWLNASNKAIGTSLVKTYTATTSGWRQATGSLVAPAGTASAQIQMVVSSLSATIYVDDFIFQ
jgi:hypothetical protein